MVPSPLDQFRTVVLDDPGLQQELRDCADRAAFVARVIERAKKRGIMIDPAEVETALNAAARSWLERWIER